MSKFLKAVKEDTRIPDNYQKILKDIFDGMKKEPTPRPLKPDRADDTQVEQARSGMLVTTELEEGGFVLNPLSMKWTKSTSPIGKLLISILGHEEFSDED